jgi:hypothetical protein
MKGQKDMILREIRQTLLTAAVLAATSCFSHAQGTFQNLNFEAANVPDVPPRQGGDRVSVSNGVPAWTVYLGGVQQGLMFHNDISIGAAEVAIYGPQWFPSQILEGNYTVSLQPSTAGPPTTAAIGQTGRIPQTAQSVIFYGDGGCALTFGGQPISLVALGSGANYTIFGGDISAFANQTGELLFQGGGLLDAIQFSTQSIPEPGVFALLALGALLLGWRALGRQR